MAEIETINSTDNHDIVVKLNEVIQKINEVLK